MSNNLVKRGLAIIMVLCMALSMMVTSSMAEDYVVLKEPTCTKNGVAKITNEDGSATYVVIPASHTKPDEGVTRLEPTCAEDGSEAYVCAACGEDVTAVIPATGEHHYIDTVSPATCTEPEKAGSFCEICGAQEPGTKTEAFGDPLDHDYVEDEEKRVEPTCTEEGVRTLVCSRCGDVKVEAIPAAGHKEASRFQPHTCTEPGKDIVFCSVCKEELRVVPLPDLDPAPGEGHVPDEGTVENEIAVTCQEDGGFDTVIRCTVCGEVLSSVHTTIASTGAEHSFELTATLKEATCTTTGIGKYTCAVCGATKYAVIAASHAWENVGDDTATCTEPGKQQQVCTVCNETRTIETPALGHAWDDGVETTAPTCGKDGEMTFTCAACQETKTEPIPATGEHAFVETVVDATCTEPAKVGSFCEACGAQEPGTEVTEVGEPEGHQYELDADDEAYLPATCTEPGLDVFVCSVCGDRYTEETEAKGHTPGKSEYLDADCENNGREVVRCAECNEIIETHDMGDLDPATGHDSQEAVKENEKPVTCTEDGSYDLVVYCANENCPKENHELSRETVTMPSTGTEHSFELTATLKEATCTTTGIGKYTCAVCGATKYEVIAASHTWENVGDNTATCTEPGEQQQVCTACNETRTIETPALGHAWDDGVETTAPTCGKDGEMTFTCAACQETKTEPIPATGEHAFVETVVDATCTEPAKVGSFCEVCGTQEPGTEVTEVGEPEGHQYELDADDEAYLSATCTEPGLDVFVCSVCGDRYTEETDVVEHVPGDGKYIDATCTESGRYVVKCEVCETILIDDSMGDADPATGHDLVVETVAPTCKEGGYTLTTCTKCDFEEKTDPTEADPMAHHYIVTVLKPKTCTANGVNKLICELCGATMYESVPACHELGEPTVVTKPTCTEEGLQTRVCSVCNVTVEEILPAIGHNYVDVVDSDGKVYQWCLNCGDEIHCKHEHTEEIPATEPTCTEDGATAGLKCLDCDTVLAEPETIPALGHKEETVPGKDATCIEEGLTEGSVCSVCGTVLVEQEVIPAAGHAYGEELTDEQGNVYKECSICGDILYISLHEHTIEIVPGKPATCTEEGLTEGSKCSVCGETLTEQEIIPALGHTEEIVPGKPASCTEEGLTEGSKCSVCGVILTEQEIIPALGHQEEIVPGKPATCTEEGLTEGVKCSVCGVILTEQEIIPALGHKEEIVPGKPASCTEEGLTEGVKCSVCGMILKVQETIAKLGHNYTVTWSFNSDYTKKIKTSVCSICGDTIVEEYPIDD